MLQRLNSEPSRGGTQNVPHCCCQPNPTASLREGEDFPSVGCPVAARQELLRSAHHCQVQTSLALSPRFPACVFPRLGTPALIVRAAHLSGGFFPIKSDTKYCVCCQPHSDLSTSRVLTCPGSGDDQVEAEGRVGEELPQPFFL